MKSRLPCTDTSPWPPGHTTEASKSRVASALDVVGVEAVIVAHEEMMAAEREIGVREAQPVRQRRIDGRRRRRRPRQEPGRPARCGIAGRRVRRGLLGRSRIARRRLRIEEAFRLGQAGDAFHVPRRLAGVAEPGLEADARIGSAALLRGPIHHDRKQRDGRDTANGRQRVSLLKLLEQRTHAIDFHALIGIHV